MPTGIYTSIITVNVNGLSAPTKRHRLVEWIQKQDPYIRYLQETNFRAQRHTQTENERMEKYSTQMEIKRKLEQQFSYQTKIDLKIKNIPRDKKGHYIMIKGSIQEVITIVNIYAPNKPTANVILTGKKLKALPL